MVRLYGNAPYKIVLVHGGPGAIGSLKGFAKEINELLLKDKTIVEYLELKKEIENDENLVSLRNKLDVLRKEICKNKEKDDQEYYELLNDYTKRPFPI